MGGARASFSPTEQPARGALIERGLGQALRLGRRQAHWGGSYGGFSYRRCTIVADVEPAFRGDVLLVSASVCLGIVPFARLWDIGDVRMSIDLKTRNFHFTNWLFPFP